MNIGIKVAILFVILMVRLIIGILHVMTGCYTHTLQRQRLQHQTLRQSELCHHPTPPQLQLPPLQMDTGIKVAIPFVILMARLIIGILHAMIGCYTHTLQLQRLQNQTLRQSELHRHPTTLPEPNRRPAANRLPIFREPHRRMTHRRFRPHHTRAQARNTTVTIGQAMGKKRKR